MTGRWIGTIGRMHPNKASIHRWGYMKYFQLLIAPFMIAIFVFSSFAQEDSTEIVLEPDQAHEVVVRILRDKFKPAKEPRTVELFEEGLKWEWLPSIDNVFFVLVSKKELEARKIEVYFFKTKACLSKGEISVDFGFGNPFCSASGSTWIYKERKGPASLRANSGGWGMGCGSGTGH